MKKTITCTALLFAVVLFASSLQSQDRADILPALRGESAVEKLKETGQYDDLIKAAGFGNESASIGQVGQSAKIFSADSAAFDNFGFSVAIDGNTAVIGAYQADVGTNDGQGAAYVFVRNNSLWALQQKLTASDGAAFDLFGFGVAIDGDTVIVGAAQDNIGTNNEQGSAYVFVRNGTTWTEQQKLISPSGDTNDFFGENVAIEGNTAVIGAHGGSIAADEHRGEAHVFVRTGTVWIHQQTLRASDGEINDGFGFSVAISGETVVVGAWHDETGANNSQGSAYVFVRSGTTWSQQQKLLASDGAAADTFGISVAIEGNTAVVGAFFGRVGSNSRPGSAYVFVRSGTAWSEQQKLVASDGANGDEFGRSVAISGDTVIVGAVSDNGGSQFGRGSAYVFGRSGTTWSQQQHLTASDASPGDHLGSSVSISGNTILAGAARADVPSPDALAPQVAEQGAAYAFAPKASVSGRVTTADGNGVSRAIVYLTLANGQTLVTYPSSFGYYRFDAIDVDQTVTINVSSKRFQFAPRMVLVNDNLTDVDMVAMP